MIDPRLTLKALSVAVLCNYATSLPAQEVETPELPDLQSALSPSEPLSADPNVLLEQLAQEDDPIEAGRLASEILERWSHSGSDAMDLLMTRADEAVEADDLPRAIAHLTALTDHAPDFAEGWNKRAEVFFLMDEYGAAMTDIEQVLILEPRHFGALAGLGIMLEQMGQDRPALKAYRAAQAIYPAEENINDSVERLEAKTGGRAL
jgi:tetratricopeptide (TPR) repeat protein